MGKRTNVQIEADHLRVREYLKHHRRGFSAASMERDLNLPSHSGTFHLHRLIEKGEVVRIGRYKWKPAQPGTIEDSTVRVVVPDMKCDEPTTEKGKRIQAMVKKYGWDATVDMIEAFGMGR